MSKRAINNIIFSVLALIIVAGAFTPTLVKAQYTYGPDYSTFGTAGVGYQYSPSSYYYPDYSSQYYYPQSNQYYYPTYPTEPRYYSYAPDPYYYGPQYYYPTYPEPQQYYYPSQYYPSYYYPQYPHHNYHYDDDEEPLRVTCKVDRYEAEVGEYVTWTAKATGGTGSYRYSWAGDRMTSNDDDRQVRVKYRDDGLKSPTVTVRSGDQRVVRQCPVIVVED
jgi:hypothetical protein